MFKEFCRYFNIPEVDMYNSEMENRLNNVEKITIGFNELLSNYQGSSFGEGLYRLHDYDNIEKWNSIVLEAFPDFRDRIQCFGYDWLGRQFSLDKLRLVNGQPQILMFEPGTGEVLEIPCSFIQFHNDEIPNFHEACLASEFFDEWMSKRKEKLAKNQCAGYKVMLFLGGEDTVDNLEISDMEVYWAICGQLINMA